MDIISFFDEEFSIVLQYSKVLVCCMSFLRLLLYKSYYSNDLLRQMLVDHITVHYIQILVHGKFTKTTWQG